MEALASTNWLVYAYALGAVQGVFLAAILASKRHTSVPNRILALTMLAFALDLATAVYHATALHEVFPHLIGIDFPLAFLYGPLLYLYAHTLSSGEHSFRKRSLWHFAPFALVVLLLLPFYAREGAEKLAFLHGTGQDLWMQKLAVANHLKLPHALFYIVGILVLLKRHRQRVQDAFSYTEHVTLNWLRDLMIGIIVVAGFTAVLYVLALGTPTPAIGPDPATVYDDYTILGLAVLVYATGFMGLRQPEVFDSRWANGEIAHQNPLDASGPPARAEAKPEAPAPISDKPRYVRSGMGPEAADQCKQALLKLMETEKPYRRGDLTLADLADALAVSPHNLTEIINTRIGLSFYDFVNGYRVREVQTRLADPQHAHLTLLAIGLEAGFNAKSSFNAVFKKHTGMTPSAFRAQHGTRGA